MNIVFNCWQEEIIYDDHGCPCVTQFRTTFTIGGVQFSAEFYDLSRAVRVYHNIQLVVTVYHDTKLTTYTAEELIKAELHNNSYFQKFARDKMFERLGNLNRSLYEKLLGDAYD